MGKANELRQAIRERVIANAMVIEDAELLVVERMAVDAIAVKNAGVCCQARQDRGRSVFFSPVKNVGERVPVGFVAQVRLTRFRAGDNRSVNFFGQKICSRKIKICQMVLDAVTARNFWKRIKLKMHENFASGGIKEREKL